VTRAPGGEPAFVAPQLCTLVSAPPEGNEWLHEVKFDGYRILCRLASGRVTLWSRNEKDWTASFPDIASEAARLPARAALLDGEVVVVSESGSTSFNALQNALSGKAGGKLAYYAFDLLHLDGRDLRDDPLESRRAELRALLPRRGKARLRLSENVKGFGREVLEAACKSGLEGIVSKRRDARYRSGRGDAWLKTKCHREQEFVIGGFTEPEGSRPFLGALLLGVYGREGRLEFAGKVGTGFSNASARDLRKRLDGLRRIESPFASRPRGVANARFVEPRLVAVVRFTEWTGDGKLRHPSFQGLREDKAAREVVREKERT
jgi:bifunctional non-homologous end joining protein LigD